MAERKKKTDVMFSLMSILLRAGATGIVANSRFARSNKWSQGGLHLTLQRLCQKRVVICTSNGHDKRVTIGSGIECHQDWLLAIYGGVNEVPPRYQKYINVVEPSTLSPAVNSSPTMLRFTQVGAELVKATNDAVAELMEKNRILQQKLHEFEERMRKINELSS